MSKLCSYFKLALGSFKKMAYTSPKPKDNAHLPLHSEQLMNYEQKLPTLILGTVANKFHIMSRQSYLPVKYQKPSLQCTFHAQQHFFAAAYLDAGTEVPSDTLSLRKFLQLYQRV